MMLGFGNVFVWFVIRYLYGVISNVRWFSRSVSKIRFMSSICVNK